MDLRFIYLISFFASLLAIIIYFEINSGKINKNYLMLFLTTLISNFGYAMSVYANSLEAAMSGNLISYIVSIFTIMFMLVILIKIIIMVLRLHLHISLVFIQDMNR